MTVYETIQQYRELAGKINPAVPKENSRELGFHLLKDNSEIFEGDSVLLFLNKDIDNRACLRIAKPTNQIDLINLTEPKWENKHSLAHFLDVRENPNMHCGDKLLRTTA